MLWKLFVWLGCCVIRCSFVYILIPLEAAKLQALTYALIFPGFWSGGKYKPSQGNDGGNSIHRLNSKGYVG